jgi:tight adherence protein B
MIVRSVRAGIPLHEALRTVARESPAPTAGQFQRVSDEMAIGIRLEDSLKDLARRTGVPEYAFFSVALTLQMQTGGSLAETLDSLADVIRKRVALRQRAVALAAEARLSSMVLASLPVLTCAALAVIDFDYIRPLFETARGERILYTAIGLLLFAGLVMRGMIQGSLR